jgi:hypothetical protein
MNFQTFRKILCHFSFSEKQIRPNENIWNLTISLTSHNTSVVCFFVVGNEWPNNNGAIPKLFLPLYISEMR